MMQTQIALSCWGGGEINNYGAQQTIRLLVMWLYNTELIDFQWGVT